MRKYSENRVLAFFAGGQGVVGSNPAAPTIKSDR